MRSTHFLLIILPSILAKPLPGTSETSLEPTDPDISDISDVSDVSDSIQSESNVVAVSNSGSDDSGSLPILATNPVSCGSQSDSGTSVDLATDQPWDVNVVGKRQNLLDNPDQFLAEGQKLEQKPDRSGVCVPRPNPLAPPATGKRRTPGRQWPDFPRWVQRCWNAPMAWALCCAGMTYIPRHIPLPEEQQKDIVNVEECFAVETLEQAKDPRCNDPEKRFCCYETIDPIPPTYPPSVIGQYCLPVNSPRIHEADDDP